MTILIQGNEDSACAKIKYIEFLNFVISNVLITSLIFEKITLKNSIVLSFFTLQLSS